ncbi:MAG: DUF427 domain-containing protein [Pseudomonadota bacterium]
MSLPKPESVWDYPRPPRIESIDWPLKIVHRGQTLAETVRAVRVLETSHPPSYYFPMADVDGSRLVPSDSSSWCEWKGRARYWHLEDRGHPTILDCAWSYPSPVQYQLNNRISFYAGRVDACFIHGEPVLAQAGDFYGGWITRWLTGPFKGAPGTLGW